MLTYLLGKLSIGQAHAIARWAGIYEGLHTFMHGMCPCQVDLDPVCSQCERSDDCECEVGVL